MSNILIRKPVVFYKTDVKANIQAGLSAFITPINHYSPYVSNNTLVRTSAVIRVLDNGVFETQNSIYKPEEMQ